MAGQKGKNVVNKQEVFDTVVRHLGKQGERAVAYDAYDEGSRCVYRASDGKKCAVGCLIPDEMYKPEMEGGSIRYLLDNFAADLPSYISEHQDILWRLQIAHDTVWKRDSDACFKDHLKSIAADFSLLDAVVVEAFPLE